MTTRAEFLPKLNELLALSQLNGRSLFVERSDLPRIGRLYIQQKGGEYLSIAWNYSGIEPRFEVFHLSFCAAVDLPANAIRGVEIPPYDAVALAIRCEWVRPVENEQPGLDAFVEEVGRPGEVPPSATAIARYVYGLIFISAFRPVFAVHVSEQEIDSLAIASTKEEVDGIVLQCDIERIEAGWSADL